MVIRQTILREQRRLAIVGVIELLLVDADALDLGIGQVTQLAQVAVNHAAARTEHGLSGHLISGRETGPNREGIRILEVAVAAAIPKAFVDDAAKEAAGAGVGNRRT